jgi:hypothetical protein
VRIFTKLANKLFGRFIPVAPFVQAMADGLCKDPTNYAMTLMASHTKLEFRQKEGALADNGFVLTIRREPVLTASLSTMFFDAVAINAKEGQLLTGAAEAWITSGEQRDFSIVQLPDGAVVMTRGA